nr:hypothetical protein [Yoonia sp.]
MKKKLTPKEAARAILLDYEGNKDKPPTLLGWLLDGVYQAWVIEPVFSDCASRYRAKGTVALEHHKAVRELLSRAVTEDRLLISWSLHDLRMMQSVVDEDAQSLLSHIHRNALDTVRPWYRNSVGQRQGPATLQFFAELVGYHVPVRYGPGVTGQSLRLLREQLAGGRGYAELTDKAREGWQTVVKHNQQDLLAMKAVLDYVCLLLKE